MAVANLAPLLYAAEPIVALSDDRRSVQAVELLYRGEQVPPDNELLAVLGEQEIGPYAVHINLDTSTILNLPERLIRAAAQRQKLVVEWREVPHAGHPLVHLAGATLARWRMAYGIQIAIDDVGSGLDAIGRAVSIKGGPDIFKVGVSLFHAAFRDTAARTLLVGTTQALEQVGAVVIEGIETQEHFDLAQSIASSGQGFLFPARPLRLG